MITFKNPKISVQCAECLSRDNIMCVEHTGNEKFKRTAGMEHTYIYRGSSECVNCGYHLSMSVYLTEYPKGILNNIDIFCPTMNIIDNITEESLDIV